MHCYPIFSDQVRQWRTEKPLVSKILDNKTRQKDVNDVMADDSSKTVDDVTTYKANKRKDAAGVTYRPVSMCNKLGASTFALQVAMGFVVFCQGLIQAS